MKQLPLLAGCCVILIGLYGCEGADRGSAGVVEGDGRFPAFLVGTWREQPGDTGSGGKCDEDRSYWEFTFEPDGSISSMMHHFVTVRMDVQDGGADEDLGMDGFAINDLGPCNLSYDPQTRQLEVEVIMEYWRIDLPIGVLEGSMRDKIVGTVSKDGRTWKASWWNYPELDGADPVDPNDITPTELSFIKMKVE